MPDMVGRKISPPDDSTVREITEKGTEAKTERKKRVPLTPDHELWEDFAERLNGPEEVNFRDGEDGTLDRSASILAS